MGIRSRKPGTKNTKQKPETGLVRIIISNLKILFVWTLRRTSISSHLFSFPESHPSRLLDVGGCGSRTGSTQGSTDKVQKTTSRLASMGPCGLISTAPYYQSNKKPAKPPCMQGSLLPRPTQSIFPTISPLHALAGRLDGTRHSMNLHKSVGHPSHWIPVEPVKSAGTAPGEDC